MIQKMQKLTFLVTSQEYESFLNEIRELGVVHIDELQKGATSDELLSALSLAERYRNAVKALDFAKETYQPATGYSGKPVDASKGLSLIGEIEGLLAEELSLRHKIDAADKNIAALEPWGNFDNSLLDRLSESGYKAFFFVCSSKYFKPEWAELYYATPINEISKKTYFMAFASEMPDIAAEHISLPQRSLTSYLEEKQTLQQHLDGVHQQMLRINAEYRQSILAAQLENENDISLSKVHLSHESIADDAVRLLVGWTLAEKTDAVIDYLDSARIYYEVSEPSYEEDVPVQIKNSWYTTLFEPILRMYSLPKYKDIDPLPLFAPFFMLFFGLCMGDAGYGAIILLLSLLIGFTKPALRKYGFLGAFLGGMTIVCGLITGSFLGIDLASVDWAWIKPLQPYFLNDSKKDYFFGYSPMMVISVIIGLVQVLIGMTMAGCKAVKNYGPVYGVGKFSWVTALLSATVLFGVPMFGVVLPMWLQSVLYALIALSAVGIMFLNSPGAYKRPIVGVASNIGGGIWACYGMATGMLGDLLSYIRLFALGLTGGVLGSVFNSLAIDMTASLSWSIRWLPLIIILLFGHGINFALCMISSFVHPMRLTFVEYFKNADFEGGGTEYNPFRMKRYAHNH